MSWREDYLVKRYPELVPDYDRLVAACRKAESGATITQEDIDAVRTALQSPRGPLWENSVDKVKRLSLSNGQFFDLIVETISHSKAHARFAAICCLDGDHDRDFLETKLRTALTDKSSKVRWKAAHVCNKLKLSGLIVDLENAVKRESNQKARSSIQYSLNLLRDGFIVTPKENGWVSLSVDVDGRGTSIRSVSEDELRTRGIPALVQEMTENSVLRRLGLNKR